MVNVPPSTYSLSPPPPDLLPSLPPPQAARRAAVAQTLSAAFSFMGFLRVSRSGSGAPDGATDVEVQGVAIAVVADERVRDVDAVHGLPVDQAVAAEVHELTALGLLAQLLEQALRDLLEPDAAVLLLADDDVGHLRGVGADVPGGVDLRGLRRCHGERWQLGVAELGDH